MTALLNGQAELRAGDAAALVVGDHTPYGWTEVGPDWWSAPDVRTFDQPRSGANGYTAGRDLLGKHIDNFQVNIFGTSDTDVGDKIDRWKAATAHSADDGLVAVRLCAFGRTRVRYGRFRKPGEINASQGRANAWLIGTTQFEALDPRTFADDVHVATTGRVLPGTGFTPPFAVPFTLGASSSGSVAVINAGNAPAPWTARLDGPLTNPTITYVEIGRRLAFQANGGLDLASGDYLELSTIGRSALLAGVSDRRTQLTIDSDWWELGPGSATFRLDADAGNGLLTVTVVDAFYS